MEIFASPMACSLASHITRARPVCRRQGPPCVENKKTADGGDYYKISAKGEVPALRTRRRPGANEGPSVPLQYLDDPTGGRRPSRAGAAPGAQSSVPAPRHAETNRLNRSCTSASSTNVLQPNRGGADQGSSPGAC